MNKYSCFIHKHTQSSWKFIHKKCGLGRKSHYGVRIKSTYMCFGSSKEDKYNALVVSQANRLLEHTQQFYDHLQEGLLKDQIRETLENVKCFNYQQDEN